MQLRMWTYDLAREQSPTLDHLRSFCRATLESGYNAFGLYLEHRFAYPSTPWSHGKGCVTPEMVRYLEVEYPDLQIIPFVNLLGHFEGLLYTEAGRQYAESRFSGMQACPSKPGFVALANTLLDDVLAAFSSEIVHIGGDETMQLGACPVCAGRIKVYSEQPGVDGKAELYGEHFGVLAERAAQLGRRPAVWGDMFFEHPTALQRMPAQTLIFDWQYFNGPHETGEMFREKGFEVVYCPTLHTYNAGWFHLPQSEQNVRSHAVAARTDDVFGVCLTTWECALFGNYETLLPAIRAAGKLIADPCPQARSTELRATELPSDAPQTAPPSTTPSAPKPYAELREAPAFLREYLHLGERHEEWARLMGSELQDVGGIFAFGEIRSSLKCRLLLYSNPFLAWLHHRDELCGESGTRALEILERAVSVAPDAAYRGVSEFLRLGIEFVRHAEQSHRFYAAGVPGEAAAALIPCRQVFENLAKIAKATHVRIGGSLADIERCAVAQRHVETVVRRIKEYGDGALGYLPSFETLSHPKFMPHDQANWWLINSWANQ